MHGDDCFGLAAGLGDAVGDGRVKQFGVHVPRPGLAVDKYGLCALVDNRVGRGGKCEALADDFVALSYAEEHEREMYGGCACRKGCDFLSCRLRVAVDEEFFQILLEAVDIGPQRHDPAFGESFVDKALFGAAHVGETQMYFFSLHICLLIVWSLTGGLPV